MAIRFNAATQEKIEKIIESGYVIRSREPFKWLFILNQKVVLNKFPDEAVSIILTDLILKH
jgi:hypothetical protein